MNTDKSQPEFLKEIEDYDRQKEQEQKDLEAAAEKEQQDIKSYLERVNRKTAASDLLAHIETWQQGYSKYWPTGVDSLDRKLDGGFFPKQLIVLGAISSLGKTSLALQIADNIARANQDVLFFSLEMDKDELLSKSISRETYFLAEQDKEKQKYRLRTRDILKGNVGRLGDPQRDFFAQALEKTQELDGHLFYFIGNNDVDVDVIRSAVELHKKATGRDPIVFIDYLQILRPSDDSQKRRLDKRLATDDDVTKLRVMARELNIPVVLISAFNRESYLQPVSTSSFKESSGIEYSADVLLGMQYINNDYKKITRWIADRNDKKRKVTSYESKQDHEFRVRDDFDRYDRQAVRPIQLKILKSRTGEKGSVFLDFVAPYNYFSSIGTDENAPTDFKECIDAPFDDDEDFEIIANGKPVKVTGETL